MHTRTTLLTGLIVASALASAGSAFAADTDVSAEISALKARIADLEKKDNENWLTEERKSEIRSLVKETIEDARQRGQFADSATSVGYKDGFYITDGANYKLVFNGFAQVRYSYGMHHDANTGDSLHPAGMSATHNTVDENGFNIRRARIAFSGWAFDPKIFFKFEGDFYGNATGNFTVTDAYIGYALADIAKVKVGSFKVPFSKMSLDSDTKMNLMSRSEVITAMLGNDAPRAIGISIFGDIIKDQLNYEFNINNGISTNTLRNPDTVGTTANLDNRLGFYGRMNWVGAGSIKDFGDHPDLRTGDRSLVWMLGVAGGYESQTSVTGSNPSPQSTAAGGISNDGSPGFTNYTLNGDVFRGTVDLSAKYEGFSFQAAALFEQFNANPQAGTVSTGLPAGGDSSFFQHGYYTQLGYMITPQIEIAGRIGLLYTEGRPNVGEYYTLGANYYLYKHNAKLSADVTYSPEAAFTFPSEDDLQNTHEVAFRLQLQLAF
jgi:phosphate-selective porin OprO and OprP